MHVSLKNKMEKLKTREFLEARSWREAGNLEEREPEKGA